MTKNTEIEWTFHGAPGLFEDICQVMRSLGWTLAEGGQHHLLTTYYDTPDLKIRAHNKMVLRVRVQDGTIFTQTIKSRKKKTSDSAMAQRFEYEVPITTARPDLTAIDPAQVTMPDIDASDLTPLFITDYQRYYKTFDLPGGPARVQICHDIGQVRVCAGDHAPLPVDEIEIELVTGAVDVASHLVDDLRATLHGKLMAQPLGKGRRGLDLFEKLSDLA